MKHPYSADEIKDRVRAEAGRLLEPWLVDRPPNFSCDQATRDLVATNYWLQEELLRLCANDADRLTQMGKYNRQSRSYDIFETAAECLNEVIDGKVEQNRKPHRRWG